MCGDMLGVGLQRGSSGDEHESSSPQRLGFWHHSSLIRGGTQFPTNVFHSWWMRQQGADSKTNYASYLWGMQSRPEVRYNKETDVCVCVCSRVSVTSVWQTAREIVVAGRRTGFEAGRRHAPTRLQGTQSRQAPFSLALSVSLLWVYSCHQD